MSRKMYLYSVKIILALLMGIFMSVAAGSVMTAHATETQTVEVIEDEDTALADSGAGGGGMFLLMGGFVVIILSVVIAVVATFVSTAAISDEL